MRVGRKGGGVRKLPARHAIGAAGYLQVRDAAPILHPHQQHGLASISTAAGLNTVLASYGSMLAVTIGLQGDRVKRLAAAAPIGASLLIALSA